MGAWNPVSHVGQRVLFAASTVLFSVGVGMRSHLRSDGPFKQSADPRSVPKPESCGQLSIGLTPLRSLTVPRTDSVHVGFELRVEIRRDGYAFVGPTADWRDILAFDPFGNFRGRVLRDVASRNWDYRLGIAGFALTESDELLVLSAASPRAVAISPQGNTRQFVTILGAATDAIMLDSTALIIAGRVRTPERAGLPLHSVDLRSGAVRSFGSDNPVLSPTRPFEDVRVIAQSRRGDAVWSVMRNRLLIERWDLSMRRTHRFALEKPWLIPWEPSERKRTQPSRLARGYIRGIHEDSAGRLWLLANIESDTTVVDNWRAEKKREGLPPDSLARANDSVIHVMCSSNGNTVGELRVGQFLSGFSRDGYVASRVPGSATIQIWQVVFGAKSTRRLGR